MDNLTCVHKTSHGPRLNTPLQGTRATRHDLHTVFDTHTHTHSTEHGGRAVSVVAYSPSDTFPSRSIDSESENQALGNVVGRVGKNG